MKKKKLLDHLNNNGALEGEASNKVELLPNF